MHLDLSSFLELSVRPLTLGQGECLPRMLGSWVRDVSNGKLEPVFCGFTDGSLMTRDQQSAFITVHLPGITITLVNLISHPRVSLPWRWPWSWDGGHCPEWCSRTKTVSQEAERERKIRTRHQARVTEEPKRGNVAVGLAGRGLAGVWRNANGERKKQWENSSNDRGTFFWWIKKPE